jgi:Ca-activated chloride channel family protein
MRSICAVAIAIGLSSSAHAQTPPRMEAMMIASGIRESRPIPIVEERLEVTIDGQEASSKLLQVYRNETSARIEGQYHLRPGSGSHVDGFAYWNGETKIVGEVFERETAREVYKRVTTRRRDPGLLEADGEGAFSFKVFPVEPNEKKRVEVRWNRWLERRDQTVHYVAPISRQDAEIVITLLGPATNVRSSTHRLHRESIAGGVRLRADNGTSAGQIDLAWDVDEPAWTPDVYVHSDGKNDGYFAMSLATPRQSGTPAPKDVTIVIDRSGSMEGDPIAHADAAAAEMIKLLGDSDRVNVIAFSDEVDPLFRTPQPVAESRAHAISFAHGLHAGGGTDIALALSTAIKSQDRQQGRPRIIVFMTDGQSDVEKAMQAAQTDTGDVRMFTLGLGKDVNRPLLQRLAALKRGRFAYIADALAIEPEVRRVAEHIARPVLVDLSFDVDGAQAVRLYPRSLPDLFAEDELVVAGRIRGTGKAKLTIKGTLAGKPVAYTRTVDLSRPIARPWVGGLWAQSRVEHLLEELSLKSAQPEMRDEVIELALAYNFVTPYTAFLAVPESELGDMAGTVAAAREQKQKIMAANPDAAALGSRRQGIDMADHDAPASFGRAPSRPMADRGDDDSDASPGYAELSSSRHHGCAGCASSGADGAWVLIVGVALFARRRRR